MGDEASAAPAGSCAALTTALELGSGELAARSDAVDAIVVLGHDPPLDAQGIEYETRVRVEQGIALFRAGRAPWLLFSGGPAQGDVVEADVMAEHAQQQGVPAAAILRERVSRDTIENARLSLALLQAKLALARAPRVLLVTSDYHSERAAQMFRRAGAEVTAAAVTIALPAEERSRREGLERLARLYHRLVDERESANS